MKNALINKVITGLAIVSICTVGLPFQLWASGPCTTEYGGENENNPPSCAGYIHTLPSGSNTFKWNEHSENLDDYTWELVPWGGGAAICTVNDTFTSRTNEYEWDSTTCTPSSGWWVAEFDYDLSRGGSGSADPVIYWKP